MQLNKEDEHIVSRYLAHLGLRPEMFSKQERCGRKTPDFRVFRDAVLMFYCEVKTVDPDRWLNGRPKNDVVPGLKMAGGGRHDPTFNRIADDIHEAVKQFYSVNPTIELPNVLAFINRDRDCGVDDLDSVFTGNFIASNGTKHPIYRNVSEGRIQTEKRQIDLFLWFELNAPTPYLRFTCGRQEHKKQLCDLFSIEGPQIRKV